MKLDRIIPFSKKILQTIVAEGDIVVDATMGNGYDTVFLANLVGKTGHVFAFDIQQQALKNTKQRLENEQLTSQVTLLQSSHANIFEHIPKAYHGKIAGAIFNLGYLPGGDKSIVTTPDSTITAIKNLLQMLKSEGIIVLVIYHGHEEGKIERDKLLDYVQNLKQEQAHVLQYGFVNQKNDPPFIIAIEKNKN
jgi:16S rRNA C1402 N4-methylase RsmH